MRPRSCFGNRRRHATREGRHALRADRRSTSHPEIDDDLIVTVQIKLRVIKDRPGRRCNSLPFPKAR